MTTQSEAGTDGLTITGPGVKLFQMLALRGALKLEIVGMKRRGRPVASIIRDQLGSKTRNRVKLLAEWDAAIQTWAEEAGFPKPKLD